MNHETSDRFLKTADELNAKCANPDDHITPEMIEAAVKNFERVEKMRKDSKGKFRVLGVDKFSHEDWVEGEYDTAEEALQIARTKTNNAKKKV